MKKIAIIMVSEVGYYDSYEKFEYLIKDWFEATDEEVQVYREYVHILNAKSRDGTYLLVYNNDNIDDFAFEEAKKVVEENREKERVKKQKAKERAAKAKATREKNKKIRARARLVQDFIDTGLTKKAAEQKVDDIISKS